MYALRSSTVPILRWMKSGLTFTPAGPPGLTRFTGWRRGSPARGGTVKTRGLSPGSKSLARGCAPWPAR
jgi:hypothetical protein